MNLRFLILWLRIRHSFCRTPSGIWRLNFYHRSLWNAILLQVKYQMCKITHTSVIFYVNVAVGLWKSFIRPKHKPFYSLNS